MHTAICRSILNNVSLRCISTLSSLKLSYKFINMLSITQHNCANNFLKPIHITKYHNHFMTTNDTHKTEKQTDGVFSIKEIHEFLVQHNCKDIVFIELPDHINYLPYFIVATANSYRHLNHTSESLNRFYKDKKSPDDPFTVIDGKKGNQTWHSIDVKNAVVHIMLEEARNKYQLEKLWVLGPDHDSLMSEQQALQDDAAYSLIDFEKKKGIVTREDSVTFVDDLEIANPWDVDYDEKIPKTTTIDDFDEDEYVV